MVVPTSKIKLGLFLIINGIWCFNRGATEHYPAPECNPLLAGYFIARTPLQAVVNRPYPIIILMEAHYNHFNFQITLQQLHLNLHFAPFKLKLLLKYNKNALESSPITVKQKVTSISEIFCFDCELPFKKTRDKGSVYI